MAMIKCDECGREISSKSLFCPNCGHPTHLNAGHPDGVEPEAFRRLKQAVGAVKPAEAAAVAAPEAEKPAVKPEPVPVPEPVAATAPEPGEETEETPAEVTEQLDSAIDEYEATLEGGRDRRRNNERAKVALFLGGFLAILGVVLYFYFTSPVETVGEDVAEEEVDRNASDTLDQTAPPADMTGEVGEYEADTVARHAIVPATRPAPAAKPAAPAAPASPAAETEEPHEIRVAPLSEQAAHPESE